MGIMGKDLKIRVRKTHSRFMNVFFFYSRENGVGKNVIFVLWLWWKRIIIENDRE